MYSCGQNIFHWYEIYAIITFSGTVIHESDIIFLFLVILASYNSKVYNHSCFLIFYFEKIDYNTLVVQNFMSNHEANEKICNIVIHMYEIYCGTLLAWLAIYQILQLFFIDHWPFNLIFNKRYESRGNSKFNDFMEFRILKIIVRHHLSAKNLESKITRTSNHAIF